MSRLGRYVNAILTGNKDNLPAPRSETERELYEAAMKGMSGGLPFGETTVTLIDNQTITLSEGMGQLEGFTLEKNTVYTVIYNGTEYADLAVTTIDVGGTAYLIGNAGFMYGTGDNGIPFVIGTQGGESMVVDIANGESCTITVIVNKIEQIDGKYLEPFETITVGKDTLEWDGNTNGLYSPKDGCYFVSDAIPSYEELSNGVVVDMTNVNGRENVEITSDTIIDRSDDLGIISFAGGYVIVATKPNATGYFDEVFEKTGVYFSKTTATNASGTIPIQIHSIKINGYTGFKEEQTKLKEECLPDGAGGGGVMRVNITYEGIDESTLNFTNCSADKTYEEIKKIVDNNGFAYATITIGATTNIIPLTAHSVIDNGGADDYSSFDFMMSMGGQTLLINVRDDGKVAVMFQS